MDSFHFLLSIFPYLLIYLQKCKEASTKYSNYKSILLLHSNISVIFGEREERGGEANLFYTPHLGEWGGGEGTVHSAQERPHKTRKGKKKGHRQENKINK